jgi:hypothetical protein
VRAGVEGERKLRNNIKNICGHCLLFTILTIHLIQKKLSIVYTESPTASLSFLSIPAMSHYTESSGGVRARSRHQGGQSRHIYFDPISAESGFPLVHCPECDVARVVEGRTRKEGENHGRIYFKCVRNGVSIACCFTQIHCVRVLI